MKVQYSLTAIVQYQELASGPIQKVYLRIGRCAKVDKQAAKRVLKACRMIAGMVHFDASADHLDGWDGYTAFGSQEGIYDWLCDGR